MREIAAVGGFVLFLGFFFWALRALHKEAQRQARQYFEGKLYHRLDS